MGGRSWYADSDLSSIVDSPTIVPVGRDTEFQPLETLPFEGRYAVRGKLGAGGMGEVRLVDDHQVGRSVALKVLLPGASPEADARFVREARIQGQLEHPSVVPVYDLGVGPDERPYFTMRRVRGVTLEDVLTSLRAGDADTAARFPRRRLLGALLQVCLAVDFSHESEVLHRDLKPANIMLGDFGEVYVLDWGLAKHTETGDVGAGGADAQREVREGHTLPGSSMGTPGYASPEQLGGRLDEIGPWSDVYALGALLFEVLTLQHLHTPGTFEQVLASTLRGAEARPSIRSPEAAIAPELENICVSATALRCEDRLSRARDLHDALDRYLGGERDVELRVQLASSHAQRAVEAADRCSAGEASFDDRRRAMREIGRALALDPNNESALHTLVRLMNAPPDRAPPEVEEELFRSENRRMVQGARFAGFAYLSFLGYLPFLLWAGVKSALPVVLFYVCILFAAGVSFWTGFGPKPNQGQAFAVMVLSNLAYAIASSFYGPLVLVPGMIAINTVAYAMLFDRPMRFASAVFGCLAMLGPIALELGGAMLPSYAFDASGLTIHSKALEVPAAPTWIFLSLVCVAIVVTGSVSAGYIKDTLRRAERRLHLYAWHIRELAPTATSGRGLRIEPNHDVLPG